MGDRLWAGKPSRYVTNHLDQLSLPSLRGRSNRVPACLAGVRRGEFTCVGWKVTLCDHIWQVTPRISEMSASATEVFLAHTGALQIRLLLLFYYY